MSVISKILPSVLQFLSSINHHLQVPHLIFPDSIFLHAPLPPSFFPFFLSGFVSHSFLLASVLSPSLKHLALISWRTGSLLLCSSPHTLFTSFLPSFPSSLSSADEAARCDLYAVGDVKSLPVGCKQPVPAVLLLIKFSSKAQVSLSQSQTRTNGERRSDSSRLPAPSVCLKLLSSLSDSLSIILLKPKPLPISKIQLVNAAGRYCSAQTADRSRMVRRLE